MDRTPLARGAALTVVLVALLAVVIPETQDVQAQARKYPYPTKRDLGATIPPGPRLLPSPPLGAGPWTFRTTEANITVSIVARGISHPYAFAFLPAIPQPNAALFQFVVIFRAQVH